MNPIHKLYLFHFQTFYLIHINQIALMASDKIFRELYLHFIQLLQNSDIPPGFIDIYIPSVTFYVPYIIYLNLYDFSLCLQQYKILIFLMHHRNRFINHFYYFRFTYRLYQEIKGLSLKNFF